MNVTRYLLLTGMMMSEKYLSWWEVAVLLILTGIMMVFVCGCRAVKVTITPDKVSCFACGLFTDTGLDYVGVDDKSVTAGKYGSQTDKLRIIIPTVGVLESN